MFRFAIAVLAAIGLGTLLFGGVTGLAVGAGWLLLAPLFFIFKIMLFVMIFGMFKAAFGHGRRQSARGPWGWRPSPDRPVERGPSSREQFQEWHNLEHARKEVDSWVEPEL
jgi:hypothetical protein